jgi:replicative DNA helicase
MSDTPVSFVPESNYARESEQVILGALMMSPHLLDTIGDIVQAGDFFFEQNQRIFTAVAGMITANKDCDAITVWEQLQQEVELDHLNALTQYVPSAANARKHAQIVRERSLSRKLQGASAEIQELAQDHQMPFEERLEKATSHLAKLLPDSGSEDWQDADAGMADFLTGIQKRSDGDDDFQSTGIRDLDDRLDGGMRPGEVIVIAGRPGMGKTSLALAIGEHAARDGAAVGVMSMEMAKAQLHNRRVSMHSRVPLHKIKRPERMSDFDWSAMSRAVEGMRKLPVFITDQTAMTINQVRSKARALKRRCGLRVLIIDYIGLMEGTDRKANRSTQLGEISRGIKALAKELGITILLLAQLNREVEKRPNQRPIMADLRECGDIEQDADIILFVHRPINAKPELGPEWKEYAEIIVGKQRDGETGTVDAQYIGECTSFYGWPRDTPKPSSLVRTSRGEL